MSCIPFLHHFAVSLSKIEINKKGNSSLKASGSANKPAPRLIALITLGQTLSEWVYSQAFWHRNRATPPKFLVKLINWLVVPEAHEKCIFWHASPPWIPCSFLSFHVPQHFQLSLEAQVWRNAALSQCFDKYSSKSEFGDVWNQFESWLALLGLRWCKSLPFGGQATALARGYDLNFGASETKKWPHPFGVNRGETGTFQDPMQTNSN